jgi:hypothetical protein
VGFFDWLFGRQKLTDEQIDELLAPQRAMLDIAEHWRAFSPDPTSDVWPLEVGTDNSELYRRIKRDGVEIRSLTGSEVVPLAEFANGFLLFTTEYDTYSAAALGNLHRQIDAGRNVGPWAVVIVKSSDEELLEREQDAWYAEKIHVLHGPSLSLESMIAGVPFRVEIGADGKVADIVEGVYCTQAGKVSNQPIVAVVDLAVDRDVDEIIAKFVKPMGVRLKERNAGSITGHSSDDLEVHVRLSLLDVAAMDHVLEFLAEADAPVGSVIYRLDKEGNKQDIFVLGPPSD